MVINALAFDHAHWSSFENIAKKHSKIENSYKQSIVPYVLQLKADMKTTEFHCIVDPVYSKFSACFQHTPFQAIPSVSLAAAFIYHLVSLIVVIPLNLRCYASKRFNATRI